jgi:ATP-dependent helicase/nuclease subunit B
MSLKFILGRAGTGKTTCIFDSIREIVANEPDGSPHILLVPEQASFQYEYSLAEKIGQKGTMRVQVLSFRRMAHRVLLETGGAAKIAIGDLGKRMVLRELMERNRAKLRIFGKMANRFGFMDCLARSVSELKTYLISPDSLNKVKNIFPDNLSLLKDKLQDVAFLYQEMDDFLAKAYTDPDDYLKLLADNMSEFQSFKNAVFWIDGFKGFTPQELLVIEKILQVNNVHITLCIDEDSIKKGLFEEELFYPTWNTFNEITEIANKIKTKINNPVILNPDIPSRFHKSPDIAHLERCFYLYPAPTFKGISSNIKIASGSNKLAEVEAAARDIISLSRENNYRWRNISVVLRNLQDYQEEIRNVFTNFGIPFFIDSKRSVLHHPLVDLIRSAIETYIKNWAYEPVFRFLKTDLIGIEREDVFKLENYVLAHGIRGQKWTDKQDWSYRLRFTLGEESELSELEQTELELINRIRRAAIKELTSFCISFNEANTVRQRTEAVYLLLEQLKAPLTINGWEKAEESLGNIEKAKEQAQVWHAVIGMFDELVESLGDLEVSQEAYLGILNSGLESLKIGLIPPGLDQVLVGSMERSRNPDVKAVFILGAIDGILPSRPSDDGIFSDSDRQKLEAAGIKLAPGARKKAFEEQFYIYQSLTRASEKLWISYPLADNEGKTVIPSIVIRRFKELFPEIRENNYPYQPESEMADETAAGYMVNSQSSLVYLGGKLREGAAGKKISLLWSALYNWQLANNLNAVRTVVNSVLHKNTVRPITVPVIRNLYGLPLKISVSRIEKYKSCPFAHFAAYGLKLKERRLFRLESPDLGEFLHAAMKQFSDSLAEKSIDWAMLNNEDCARLGEQIVSQLAPELQSEILLSSSRYKYLTGKITKAVTNATAVLAEHARRTAFKPVGYELSFGSNGDFEPLFIELSGGQKIELNGRIDRIDIAVTDNTVYYRVIDYKSSTNMISLQDIYYGLKLQLLTYLHIAITHSPEKAGLTVKPGGMLYFTLKNPVIRSSGPIPIDEIEQAILKELKMNGLLLADLELVRLMDSSAGNGYSDIIKNIAIRKDGSFYSSSSVIDENKFNIIREYLVNQLRIVGEDIINGLIDIAPYRNKKGDACTYCRFMPVCKFDILLEECTYRVLDPLTPEKALEMMERAVAEGRGKGDE